MNFKTAAMLFLGTAMSGWSATFLSVQPNPVTMNVGDTVNVDVEINNVTQLAAYSFDLVFPTFLQVLSDPIEEGFFATNGLFFSFALDNVGGSITNVSDVTGGPNYLSVSGADILLSIPFTAVATGSGQLVLQNISLSDPNGDPIFFAGVINADVVASTPQTAPTPEPAPWIMTGLGTAILLVWKTLRMARARLAQPRKSAIPDVRRDQLVLNKQELAALEVGA